MELRAWRLSEGMKLSELAPILGLSITTLSDLERGQANVSRETVARIEGATAGQVTAADHHQAFRSNHRTIYSEHRAAGRSAMAEYRRAAKKPRK